VWGLKKNIFMNNLGRLLFSMWLLLLFPRRRGDREQQLHDDPRFVFWQMQHPAANGSEGGTLTVLIPCPIISVHIESAKTTTM
jgi:hypothetical protein